MFKPNYKYVDESGFSGRCLEHNSFFIKSDIQLCSSWAGIMKNPYRDLQYGGTTVGYKGFNYWFSDNSLVGKIFKFLVV